MKAVMVDFGTKMPRGHSQDRARLERVPPECHEVAAMTGAIMFAPCVTSVDNVDNVAIVNRTFTRRGPAKRRGVTSVAPARGGNRHETSRIFGFTVLKPCYRGVRAQLGWGWLWRHISMRRNTAQISMTRNNARKTTTSTWSTDAAGLGVRAEPKRGLPLFKSMNNAVFGVLHKKRAVEGVLSSWIRLGALVAESFVEELELGVDWTKNIAPSGAGRCFGLPHYLFHILFWLNNQTLQDFAAGFVGEHDLDCNSHILWLDPPNLRERNVVGVELRAGLVGLVLGITAAAKSFFLGIDPLEKESNINLQGYVQRFNRREQGELAVEVVVVELAFELAYNALQVGKMRKCDKIEQANGEDNVTQFMHVSKIMVKSEGPKIRERTTMVGEYQKVAGPWINTASSSESRNDMVRHFNRGPRESEPAQLPREGDILSKKEDVPELGRTNLDPRVTLQSRSKRRRSKMEQKWEL
ncbi:hypothetical protein GGX14DRAFT_406443 [Mycena pura]|uniref:Uncharacterized protein n=1 Tax=Mycena pura TaxID=153505 RepID=A0AAD6UQC0_9AGAR|nr:hypothetical protein GGX14DRAFT_406443 [Mycena pura]